MVKFKVGDRVRLNEKSMNYHAHQKVGAAGTIVDIEETGSAEVGSLLYLRWDGGASDNPQMPGSGVRATRFSLVIADTPIAQILTDNNEYYLAITGDTDGQNP